MVILYHEAIQTIHCTGKSLAWSGLPRYLYRFRGSGHGFSFRFRVLQGGVLCAFWFRFAVVD